ncbi:unnamed protein product [Mesocestoides corti]|uniref:HYDIN/VesB/CFA65-like Ig-like domain-containing protein n=4 Tax=Mesocestoides corti TaxID=53468 RepID=A0A158QV52_MESCO|nr:unnamed protein product [Mesocestoides corti]
MPNSSRDIIVTFTPTSDTEFVSTAQCSVVGKSEGLSLELRGRGAGPEIAFSFRSLNVGKIFSTIAHDYELVLQNMSEITAAFSVHSQSDGFTTTPSMGTIMPNAYQAIVLTLLSWRLGPFVENISFTFEGSSRVETYFIFISSGETIAPKLSIDPPLLDFGTIAFDFAATNSATIQNLSSFPVSVFFTVNKSNSILCTPSKAYLGPTDSITLNVTYLASEIGCVKCSIHGIIQPNTVTNLQLQAQVKVTGTVFTLVHILVAGADYNPLIAEVKFHCEGPIIVLSSHELDFGKIPALVPFQRLIQLRNESPIEANLSAVQIKKTSAFSICPKELTIPPFGSAEIEATACANDVDVEFNSIVEVHVAESQNPPPTIYLRAFGQGSTITFDPEVPLCLTFGQQFDTFPHTRAFLVKNCGRRQQRLVWTVESVQSTQTTQQNEPTTEAAYNIVLEPQKFELQPLESVDFSLKVFSSRPQKITFNLKCFTVIDNHGHKRLIKECAVSAEFIQPMVEIIPNPVGFRILKVPDEILREVSQDILIKNTSEIPTTFLLTIDPPFFFRPHGSTTQQLELVLRGKEERNFVLVFDPAFAEHDRKNVILKKRLNLSTLDHPFKFGIPVHGDIAFPGLHLETDTVDFGCILNESKSVKSMVLHNNSPIEVNYRWKVTRGRISSNECVKFRGVTRSKSQEKFLIPKAPIRRVASIANIDTLDITDVFSIDPEFGSIQSGGHISVTFEFNGNANISAECTAICCVNGGMDYDVLLRGESSTSDCYIRVNEVPFGDILFLKQEKRILRIYNAGKVPSFFAVTHERNDAGLTFEPSTGEVPPQGVAEVQVHRNIDLPIRLLANVVAPEVKISDDNLDFGEVFLNEARIISVQLHNPTALPITWIHPTTTTTSLECLPKCGTLRPDQKENIFVSLIKFNPKKAGLIKEEVLISLPDSSTSFPIKCQGCGLEPQLLFEPSCADFPPLLPNGDESKMTLIVKNPCPFPVEFYSLQYDQVHMREDCALSCLQEFGETDELLLPTRGPGESLPRAIFEHSELLTQSVLGNPKTGRVRSSKQSPSSSRKKPQPSTPPDCIKTFKRFVEERRIKVEEGGIVVLVFGSPISGKTDFSKALAAHYNAAYINVEEVLRDVDPSIALASEDAAPDESFLTTRFMQDDCIFGIILDDIKSRDRCESVLKVTGKLRKNVFVVTLIRELDSVKLADSRYEEALIMAEKRAFMRKVEKYRSMEEWEYDALPRNAREEVDRVLAESKRRQHEEELENKRLIEARETLQSGRTSEADIANNEKYADLEASFRKFDKEHVRICDLLRTWDQGNQRQRADIPPLSPIRVDDENDDSTKRYETPAVGIPHFIVQSKLPNESSLTVLDHFYEQPEDVVREKPSTSVLVGRILPRLPSCEEVRRQLGYGPLSVEIPEPATFSVVYKPPTTRSLLHQESCFMIVVPQEASATLHSALMEVSGIFEFGPLLAGKSRERKEEQQISLLNPTPMLVAWTCEKAELLEDAIFSVTPTVGVLEPNNVETAVRVEFRAPSKPGKFFIKKALRFIATDIRNLVEPVTVHPYIGIQAEAVDPEIDLVLPKEGINFGLLRIDEEAKRSIVLRNNGPLKIRYSFKIFPSKEIAFGAVAVNTRTSGQVTIENGGAFDLRFAIFSAVRMQEMVSAKAARSSLRQRSSGPGPSDVTGASRVTLSPFTISPASGTIPVGGKQTISVECSVGAIAKVYEEIVGGAFIIEENSFLFENALIGTSTFATFKISNTSKVAVDANFFLRSTEAERLDKRHAVASRMKQADVGIVEAFEVIPTASLIEPYRSVWVQCQFTPKSLLTYSANFEVEFEGQGAAPPLRFKLCGKGEIPRVAITAPVSINHRGNPYLVFSSQVNSRTMEVRNTGQIACRVVAEGNKYESEVIELYGLVPNSVLHGPVIIETPRSDQVRADALHLALNPYFNAEIPPSCLGPAWMSDLQGGDVEEILQNHLNFGDCYVGCTLSSHFVLRYPDINGERSEISLATSIVDSSPSFNFAWPHDHPSLRFEPPSGELRPHTSLRICVYFHSDQPVKYRFFPVRCQLTEAPNFESSDVSWHNSLYRNCAMIHIWIRVKNISQKNQGFGYDELALGARSYEPPQNQTPLTQQSLRKTKSARSNNLRDASGTGSKSAREPLNPKSPQKEEFFVTDDEMSNGALFLELLFTAVCDFVEYELEKTSIKFPDTAIWGKSVQTLQIRNTGLVTMTFTFATASYDQPFEAEPSECLILPGQSLPLKFVFCPTKPGTFDSVFNLLVPNTTETCDPQKSITVIGKAFVKPIKLALPKSDYQPKNPQCDPFWHSAQVLEIVATGNGRKVTSVSPNAGKIPPLGEALLQFTFQPRNMVKVPLLDSMVFGIVAIPNGPSFALNLCGQSKMPTIEFSPGHLNFGHQFVQDEGLGVSTLPLIITNKDQEKPIYVAFESSTLVEFECNFSSKIIEPGAAAKAFVTFFPSACKTYRGELKFLLNEQAQVRVLASGEGTKINLTSTVTLEFKPYQVGKFNGCLEVFNPELGLSVYDLQLEAVDPIPEQPVKLKTTLGLTDTAMVTVSNLSRNRAEFTCKINDPAFRCDKLLFVAAGSSTELPVTFEPHKLGIFEALLRLSSSQAGSYIFPLQGVVEPPSPQGPFVLSTMKSTILTVKNVFFEPVEFFVQVDNADFHVDCTSKIVKPHKELRLAVTLKCKEYQTGVFGKLVVYCERNPDEPAQSTVASSKRIEWIFYLKGPIEGKALK